MKLAAAFLWLIAPLGLWLAVTLFGTPHMLWSYRFHDNGDRWNPYAHRTYIDCTYWGYGGSITVRAENGQCPWVRLFKGESR